MMAWGILVVLTIPSLAIFNEEAWRLLFVHYRGSIGGVGVGILITLKIAGQLKQSAWK